MYRTHVIILFNTKQEPYLDWILDGVKTIESRWYNHAVLPLEWNNAHTALRLLVNTGDLLRLKASGGKILGEATVQRAQLYIATTTPLEGIMRKYQHELCISNDFIAQKKDYKYGILVWLENTHRITPEIYAHQGRDAWIMI